MQNVEKVTNYLITGYKAFPAIIKECASIVSIANLTIGDVRAFTEKELVIARKYFLVVEATEESIDHFQKMLNATKEKYPDTAYKNYFLSISGKDVTETHSELVIKLDGILHEVLFDGTLIPVSYDSELESFSFANGVTFELHVTSVPLFYHSARKRCEEQKLRRESLGRELEETVRDISKLVDFERILEKGLGDLV